MQANARQITPNAARYGLASVSVATKNLDAYAVYQGNPAIKVRSRTIS